MEWIDRKNGYPKLKTKIIGNYAMMSVTLEISENESFGFGTEKDTNMTDAISYILRNVNSINDELRKELEECKTKLND